MESKKAKSGQMSVCVNGEWLTFQQIGLMQEQLRQLRMGAEPMREQLARQQRALDSQRMMVGQLRLAEEARVTSLCRSLEDAFHQNENLHRQVTELKATLARCKCGCVGVAS
jgi:hypothetical protein